MRESTSLLWWRWWTKNLESLTFSSHSNKCSNLISRAALCSTMASRITLQASLVHGRSAPVLSGFTASTQRLWPTPLRLKLWCTGVVSAGSLWSHCFSSKWCSKGKRRSTESTCLKEGKSLDSSSTQERCKMCLFHRLLKSATTRILRSLLWAFQAKKEPKSATWKWK